MTKQEFFTAMDSGEIMLPETDEQTEWWDEWFRAHPEIQKEVDADMARIDRKQAANYMCLKIFARTFIEENGTGLYFAEIEPRKITICRRLGKVAKDSLKLVIEL